MNNYCDIKKPQVVKCYPESGLTLVIVPVQSGDSTGDFAPRFGEYKNTIVKYLADNKVFAYDKDGNWTEIGETDIPGATIDTELSLNSTNAVQNKVITAGIKDAKDTASGAMDAVDSEVSARQHADGVLQDNIDAEVLARQQADGILQGNIDAEALTRQNADGTLQGNIDAEALARANAITASENKVNRNFLDDLVMTADANNVTFTEQKINPITGATSSEQDVIPAASTTTAGIISAAEYQSILDSEELTQAILEGAVAIAGISASATQADLTTAWLTATGRDEVINRASIYDIDNSLIWTYYTNASLWYSATASITIDTFTNSTAGTIKGSTADGKVSANNDGTGSVSGWSNLKDTVDSKANYKRAYNNGSIAYKKITVTGGSNSDDGVGIILMSRKQSFLINGMSASGHNGCCVEVGTNMNDTEIASNTRHINIKVYGVPSSRTTEIYCKMSPNTYVDVISSGTITIAASTDSEYISATDNAVHKTVTPPNNATLTIQKNGTDVQTFTADASSNVTANITVPTQTSELTNNSNFVADASYVHTDNNFTTTLKDKLDGIASGAEVNVQANWTQTNTSADDFIKNKPSLAAVATSGAYSDLTGKPSLATVATSGSYSDLTNKPTIPVVNNATLTIQKNGTSVQTFSANQSTNATANITVPTQFSDLTGTVSAAQIATGVVPIITMQTTDPGEGAALAANNFIAVYE